MSFGYLDIESDINFPVMLPKPVLVPVIKMILLDIFITLFYFCSANIQS